MTDPTTQAVAPTALEQSPIYWWRSGTLFHAQRGGRDPSILYTSTDLPDALEQVGYRNGIDSIHPNEAPDLETEIWS